MTMTHIRARIVLLAGLTALFAAPLPALATGTGHDHGHHGHGGQNHGHHGLSHADGDIGKPAEKAQATRTIEVTLGDLFYEPASIQVKAGETVRFVLKNGGALLHEFNIGTAARHAQRQKELAMMVEHGMLTPTGMKHDMDHGDHAGMGHSMQDMMATMHGQPNSVFVEPGKTAEITWTFAEPAELEFACNMPGHYDAGMVGGIGFAR